MFHCVKEMPTSHFSLVIFAIKWTKNKVYYKIIQQKNSIPTRNWYFEKEKKNSYRNESMDKIPDGRRDAIRCFRQFAPCVLRLSPVLFPLYNFVCFISFITYTTLQPALVLTSIFNQTNQDQIKVSLHRLCEFYTDSVMQCLALHAHTYTFCMRPLYRYWGKSSYLNIVLERHRLLLKTIHAIIFGNFK